MMENHAVICGLGDTPMADLSTHPDRSFSDGELSEFEKRAIPADWVEPEHGKRCVIGVF
jgi:hypothetical protein